MEKKANIRGEYRLPLLEPLDNDDIMPSKTDIRRKHNNPMKTKRITEDKYALLSARAALYASRRDCRLASVVGVIVRVGVKVGIGVQVSSVESN